MDVLRRYGVVVVARLDATGVGFLLKDIKPRNKGELMTYFVRRLSY